MFDLNFIAMSIASAPDPERVGAAALAKYCNSTNFPFTQDEKKLLNKILDRNFTCEPTCVRELHQLRVLYWQVVGCQRQNKENK